MVVFLTWLLSPNHFEGWKKFSKCVGVIVKYFTLLSPLSSQVCFFVAVGENSTSEQIVL
jgi:hypothetical protein